MSKLDQRGLFRGIYEFEDPAGTLIAAKSPATGTADLYDGTVVVVKPNQCAVLVYRGEIADVLPAGTHAIRTENVPVITRLANWKFGMKSPLRCEIWFFSGNVFTARRWGTAQPAIAALDGLGPTPVRAYGNYNVVIRDPKRVYLKLVGSRAHLDVADVEDFLQGQIVEFFPNAISEVRSLEDLGALQDSVSRKLERLLNDEIGEFGLQVRQVQVLSMVPPPEVIQALDARAAMKVIGNPKEYLLYKAANSLDALNDGSANDSMQMMLGLMLGKGMLGADYHDKESARRPGEALPSRPAAAAPCAGCGQALAPGQNFCGQCGRKA